MRKRVRIRVVKLGGSLLDCEQLPVLLANWLDGDELPARPAPLPSKTAARERPGLDVLIAGGGALVERIRQFDQQFTLGDETAHWMSVTAMSCTAQLLAQVLGAGTPLHGWDELVAAARTARAPTRVVFDVQQWLARHEAAQPGLRLRHDWRATSDSIGGRLAHVLSADEFVLLKSRELPGGSDWPTAAAAGLVDGQFPELAEHLPLITWVNLRRGLQNR